MDIFFLRAVAHNWADGPFIMMVKHLHSAATPEMRLVIVDWIPPYTVRTLQLRTFPVLYQPRPPLHPFSQAMDP